MDPQRLENVRGFRSISSKVISLLKSWQRFIFSQNFQVILDEFWNFQFSKFIEEFKFHVSFKFNRIRLSHSS